jgi:hypothetical protein
VRKRAYLRLENDARYLIDTVDYERGVLVDRWEAAPRAAAQLASHALHFHPLSGDRHADLERLGAMMAGCAARVRRGGSVWPIGEAGAGAVYYYAEVTGGGDGLHRYDLERRRALRIDRGLVASYDAKLSPDGERLAFRGCSGRRPCRYQLYLTNTRDAAGGRAPRRAGLMDPERPVWSDSHVFAVFGRGEGRCAARVDPSSGASMSFACDPDLRDLVMSPDGRHLVTVVRRRRDGHWTSELTYRGLEGQPLAQHVAADVGEIALGNEGVVLADRREGMLVIDMRTGAERALEDGGLVFVPTIAWLQGGRALMLSKRFAGSTLALEVLDVPAALAAR